MITTRRRALLALPLVLLACPASSQDAGALPEDVMATLQELRVSFMGIFMTMDPGSMEGSLARAGDQIEALLSFARESDTNAELLAQELRASLARFADQFAPGTEIDERFLQDRQYNPPSRGRAIDTYLLLEDAKSRGRPEDVSEALALVDRAMLAQQHLVATRTAHLHPERPAAEVERETHEFGGPDPGNLGCEMTWCCEQLMVAAYLADEPPYPEAAMAVVNEFWEWRKERMIELGRATCLHIQHANATMHYVRRLVDALPAD